LRYFFVEPFDVVMLRGNRLFGEAGSFGDAVMPPWPTVFAGAFRSLLWSALAKSDFDRIVGKEGSWGSFKLRWLSLAKDQRDGVVDIFVSIPKDTLVSSEGGGTVTLVPKQIDNAIVRSSSVLPLQCLTVGSVSGKFSSSGFVSMSELLKWLKGNGISDVVEGSELYVLESRLGIGLDSSAMTARSGALYTTQTVRMSPDVGFVVGIEGDEGKIPKSGLLRLGGDGRGARFREIVLPLSEIGKNVVPDGARRFKVLALTPLMFKRGWLPDAVHDPDFRLKLGSDFSARLVSVALGRPETITGWDMAKNRPKLAKKCVPQGSIYYFDECEGDVGAFFDWVMSGMKDSDDIGGTESTLIEGFNVAVTGVW
jgi:CRISPR-associated protein Cmr3